MSYLSITFTDNENKLWIYQNTWNTSSYCYYSNLIKSKFKNEERQILSKDKILELIDEIKQKKNNELINKKRRFDCLNIEIFYENQKFNVSLNKFNIFAL